MIKFLFPVTILCLICSYCFSQDVGAGEISRGLTSFKASSTVDHTTGIMNYNIPLLSIGQDGYKVPISLNYNASGIKVSTRVDIAGLGWDE